MSTIVPAMARTRIQNDLRSRATHKNDGSVFVQSLARGLAVITAFSTNSAEMTLTEVASQTGLTRAAARRFLLTLCDLGYTQFDGKRFRLTPKVLNLGYAYLRSNNLWDVAEPVLEDVSRKLNESSSLSVLDGDEIVYIGRVPTARIISIALNVGARLPAYCTSMGRVLLASLDAKRLDAYFQKVELRALTPYTETHPNKLRRHIDSVRRKGYATINQELEIGLRSIAVPVRTGAGRVVAAMNIGAPAQRVSMETLLKEYLPVLKEASRLIQQAHPG